MTQNVKHNVQNFLSLYTIVLESM